MSGAIAWSGTITHRRAPAADELARLDQINPAFAERAFSMAERDQRHEHRMQNVYAGLQAAGLVSGALMFLAGIGIGGWLLSIGITAGGLTALFGGLAPVVAMFVYHLVGRLRDEDEDNEDLDEVFASDEIETITAKLN